MTAVELHPGVISLFHENRRSSCGKSWGLTYQMLYSQTRADNEVAVKVDILGRP